MSNRSALIAGLFVATIIILGLGVFALVSGEADQQAAPSVTPTADEIDQTPTPRDTGPLVTPPGGLPTFASPTEAPTGAGSPATSPTGQTPQGSPAGSPTSQPQPTEPAPSPTSTGIPPIAGAPTASPTPDSSVAVTGGNTWLLGLLPLAASFGIIAALRSRPESHGSARR